MRAAVSSGSLFKKPITAILTTACLLAAGFGFISADGGAEEGSATIDVRVWQHLRVSDRIYVTALPRGGSRDERETVRVVLNEGLSRDGRYRYGAVAVAGVELRIWQRVDDSSQIKVSAGPLGAAFDTAGPVSLPLDDGFSSGGGYRYGQVRIVVPAATDDVPMVSISPAGGEVPRLAAITLRFRHAPTELDAAEHVTIQPPTGGSFVWAGERTLLFQPDYPGWRPGQRYAVTVSGDVLDQAADHVHRFSAEGRLRVAYVIPGDGDVEVPTEAQIFIQFNRSVAPLTLLDGSPASALLEFDPPMAGEGEWLNTSLYRFTPSDLRRHTEYSVSVPAELASGAAGVFDAEYRWSFTTVQPAIVDITPHDGATSVEVDNSVVISFNEPMDRTSVESGVALRTDDGSEIPGTFRWSQDSMTVSFHPSHLLTLDTHHRLVADAGLESVSGGASRVEQTADFRTIAAPRLRNTSPRDGQTDTYPSGVSLWYSNQMDIESFVGRISIDGIEPEDIELSEFTEQGTTYLPFRVRFEPLTTYTVRIAAGVGDLGGRTLPAHEFTFTTGEPRRWPVLQLSTPAAFSTYSAGRQQVLDYRVRNVGEVLFQLFRLSDSEAETLLRRGVIDERWDEEGFWPRGSVLREWTRRIDADQQSELQEYSIALGGATPLPVGHYFLAARFPASAAGRTPVNGEPEYYQRKRVFSVVDTAIVTKLAHDELLVWVVGYNTGQPLADHPVRAALVQRAPLSDYEHSRTDADGIARFRTTPDEASRLAPYGNHLVRIDEGRRHGVAATWWQYDRGPRSLGIFPSAVFPQFTGHLFTDRPIYRPGETVFYKAVVRHDDDGAHSIPGAEERFALRVRAPQHRDILDTNVQLGDLGSFGSELVLAADAATGIYLVSLSDERGRMVANAQFTVAEFRVPEFEVVVQTPRTDYIAGEIIAADAQATFYFGAPVSDVGANWTAHGWLNAIQVEGYEDYSFRDLDRAALTPLYRGRSQGGGQIRTDASGFARFELPAKLEAGDSTYEFVISATVTDDSGQAIAASSTVIVHPATWYAGIMPESYLATAGEPALVHLVTVDVERRIAPNRPITLRIYKREWVRTTEPIYRGGVYYLSEPVDTEVEVATVTTDAEGEATFEFTPPSAGSYRLVAESVDDEGRVARSARFIWASGRGYAAWPVRENDSIELIADRERYEVGDVAELLVQAPFAGATGLVTIERGGVLDSVVRRFETTSDVLRIPIEDRFVPDVYIGVVLYRPPTDDDPYPRFHIGYRRLQVSTATRELSVSIRPERDEAQPGDSVQYEVQVTDAAGNGREAEVAVAVVDQAVLSLLDDPGPNALQAFWSFRSLGVLTASSLTVSNERDGPAYDHANLRSPLYWVDEDGVEAEEDYLPATGGGGDPPADRPPVLRSDFRHTADWIERLQTDEYGRATFELQLPDNATSWHARARAVTAETQVGEGEHELTSTKPLLVRPALPRFLRVGDEVELRALITNRSAHAREFTVAIDVEGLSLDHAKPYKVWVGAGDTEEVSWNARALTIGTATIRFTAGGPRRTGDAVEHTIPVHAALTPETTATGGVVEDEPALETLYLPEFALSEGGSLEVSLQASLVGALVAELEHFKRRPRESYARVASRVMASIAVLRSSASSLSNANRLQLEADLRTLVHGQRLDGGWPWCRSCYASDIWVSGWTLVALGEAAEAGVSVPEFRFERAARLVIAHLDRDSDVAEPPDPNQQAFLMYAISRGAYAAGELPRAQTDAMHALVADHRAQLNNWGRAYLLLGLVDSGVNASHESVRTLLNDLTAASISSANGNHWQTSSTRGSMHNGSVRTTALVLRALTILDPRHPLLEQSVRWLVVARSQGRWKTSVERADGMAALSVFAQVSDESRGAYDYQVLLNGQPLLDGRFEVPAGDHRDATSIPLDLVPQGEFSRLQFDRGVGGPGRMYYALNLRYLTPATEVRALNRGFAVSRRYSLLENPDHAITSAALGDVVRVELTVIAPAERRFVTVEDFLPAGLEPIDPQLKIVSPWLREQLRTDQREALLEGGPAYVAPWFAWYLSPWDQVDLRDDRVTLVARRLPAGVHRYVYYTSVTTPGDFSVLPSHAEETYFPEVFGRSDTRRFSVRSSE